jgi:hypothetical protein
MRTTLDILIVVKESRPVDPEELRMALLAMESIDHFNGNAFNNLIEAVDSGKRGVIEIRYAFAKETRERMFQVLKSDPVQYLGAGGIPGMPEHDSRYRTAKAVAKAAGIL